MAEHNAEDLAGKSHPKIEFSSADESKERSASYCETCRKIMPETFCVTEPKRHKVESVESYAAGVKRKLHDLLSENETDESSFLNATIVLR